MVLSSENLFADLADSGIRNLGDILKPIFDDIQIICYLRRQDDTILSMYAEHMKMGYSAYSFPEFVHRTYGRHSIMPILYFRRAFAPWINVFGKDSIRLRLFDAQHLVQGDIVSDFMNILFDGNSPSLAKLRPVASSSANVSLGAPALEFLNRINSRYPRHDDGIVNDERLKLMPRILALPTQPRPVMSADLSREIMAHFRPANDWVRDSFFPDLPAPLFPPRQNLTGESNIGRITRDEFIRFATHVFGDPAPVLDLAADLR